MPDKEKYGYGRHSRRSVRLKDYDYSQEGAYFVTICAKNRECLFGQIVDTTMRLNQSGKPEKGAASGAPTLGDVVRTFKSISAILLNRRLSRTGRPLWQRNYYEHIIRNERSLNAIRNYILNNPIRWSDDPENPVSFPDS
jgi:putative transposase